MLYVRRVQFQLATGRGWQNNEYDRWSYEYRQDQPSAHRQQLQSLWITAKTTSGKWSFTRWFQDVAARNEGAVVAFLISLLTKLQVPELESTFHHGIFLQWFRRISKARQTLDSLKVLALDRYDLDVLKPFLAILAIRDVRLGTHAAGDASSFSFGRSSVTSLQYSDSSIAEKSLSRLLERTDPLEALSYIHQYSFNPLNFTSILTQHTRYTLEKLQLFTLDDYRGILIGSLRHFEVLQYVKLNIAMLIKYTKGPNAKIRSQGLNIFPSSIETVEPWGDWEWSDISLLFEGFESKQLPRLQRVAFEVTRKNGRVLSHLLEEVRHGLNFVGNKDVEGPMADIPLHLPTTHEGLLMVGVNFRDSLYSGPEFTGYGIAKKAWSTKADS